MHRGRDVGISVEPFPELPDVADDDVEDDDVPVYAAPAEPEDVVELPDEPPDPSLLTPQGRYRASVTEDPDFRWRVPSGRFLTRATGEAAKGRISRGS